MAASQKDNYDDEDVPEALKRETADGPGFQGLDNPDDLPESDFDGFAEDGVENDHDGDNAGDDQEVAQ